MSEPSHQQLLDGLRSAGAPDWYLRAIQHPTSSRRVRAPDGLTMHCRFWNEAETDKPPLLLVHGYRGHTHAWDAVAPFLTEHFRVVAFDLMGMGESDRREHYGDMGAFASDLAAVVEGLGLGAVTLVGHSVGGACGIHFAHQRPDLVRRLVIVDTMVFFPELDPPRERPQRGRPQPYPDYESIISRYRLLPAQPCPAWALAYMAHCSVRAVEGGWTWRFDTRLPATRVQFETQCLLRSLRMPTDLICGECSPIFDARRRQMIVQAISQQRHAIVIPQAHHHVLLDQPLQLVSALNALLA